MGPLVRDAAVGDIEPSEPVPPEILALVRLIALFPWLLEIADHDFDEVHTAQILVREAAKVVNSLDHCTATTVTCSLVTL